MKMLIDFAILSRGLSAKDKIKLILFALGLKPAASLYLRITSANLDEAFQFENALRFNKIIYSRGREKSFEEVRQIKSNKIIWNPAGLWVDYDLFHTYTQKKKFDEYRQLWQRGEQRTKMNRIAGKLYGYPACCIAQYNKETTQYIKKHYDYYAFYKKMHDIDKRFPLLAYTPCSMPCRKSKESQKAFASAIKKASLSFWHHLQEVSVYQTDAIIESENDILMNDKSIWPKRNGHDYVVLSIKQFDGKNWFYAVLSKKAYPRGAVLSATIKHRATYGEILLGREKDVIHDLQHERNLPLLKRGY